jgi:V8-like Glu-specific endopeptidase
MFAVSAVHADEGMWTVDNFPSDIVEQRYGARIDQSWLDRVRLATARLEGGCTGSFVSPDGLVLTNNHCTWSCLYEHTTEEENVWRDGFLADGRESERRCGQEAVSVLVALEDITAKVAEAARGLNESEANEARKKTLTRLEQACEEASDSELSCESVSLYQGGQYFLYQYKRYDDVRLVFTPENAIAAFGGDPDNFNFPRWCLDMAFLRVYEDGKPASTPDFLQWRPEGAAKGEAVFISGHPGSTDRLLTVEELKFLRNVTVPHWLIRYSELRGRYLQFSKEDEEAKRLVANRLIRIENAIKVRRNQQAALLNDELMARKQAGEEQMRAAVAADPALAAMVGNAWEDIAEAQATYLTFRDHYTFNEGRAGFQGSLFGYARTLVRAAAEREKPNEDRLREFTDGALPGVEQRLLASVPVPPRLEKLVLAYGFEKLREFLGPDDPFVHQVLGEQSPDGLAQSLVEDTRLADADYRRELWEGGAEAIARSDDPMIRLAASVDEEARSLRKRYEDDVEAVITTASENIARARFALYGTDTYPDATFTLRVTFGSVEGWMEKGERVEPFTRLERAFERATGQEPFALPKSWLTARDRLSMSTPFNFVSTLDITGGNSGSPIIDQNARLVGLAFDGNIHSIAGAYWFDTTMNRTVGVHPAIMLEALDKVYDAQSLIDELDLSSERP